MKFIELFNNVLLPFGGASAVVIALSYFLANIISKRIISSDVAKHAKDLERTKQEYNERIDFLRRESNLAIENLRSEVQKDLVKMDIYSTISKDKYQELFDKRVEAYKCLISIRNDIQKISDKEVASTFFQEGNPQEFAVKVEEINNATQQYSLLISNELADLSNKLFMKSRSVFVQAEVSSRYIEHHGPYDENKVMKLSEEEKNKELERLYDEVGDIYNEWFKQLEADLSKIRKTLDVSHQFSVIGH